MYVTDKCRVHEAGKRYFAEIMIPNLKVEVIDPVLCKGLPTSDVFESLDKMAATIAEKHRQQGFAR